MKIRLEDISLEGREEDFEHEPRWFDERLAEEDSKSYEFKGPIHVRVTLNRSGSMITVRSRIEAPMKWICARCLEPFAQGLTSEITTLFKPRPTVPDPEEVELRREDVETDFYDGDEVDLTALIQDRVLLAFPPKALCKPDCRGLCPNCGQNRNQKVCDCREDGIDPRFAALKNFRVQ